MILTRKFALQAVAQLVIFPLFLTGCIFGENKQYFASADPIGIVTGGNGSAVPLPSATATPVETATPFPSSTPIIISSPTPAPTATPIPSATPVPTATPRPTSTPVASPSPTATPVPSVTPSPTVVPVPTPTATPSATPRPSATPSPTATPSVTPSPSPTPTATPVPTASPTPSPTATPVPSATPTPTATPNPTATPVPTSQSPIAVADGPYETAQNTALSIATSDLLLNDSDPNARAIRFDSFTNPTSGTLTRLGNTLTFTPANNFLGTVTFTYRIANTLNLTADATVTINVRKPATELMYGQSGSRLYRYDPTNSTSTQVARFSLNGVYVSNVYDIAITPNGLMYGVDGTSLYYIDASTGVLTKVATTGLSSFGNINGITALSDGRLVISGNGIAIYNIATRKLSTLVAAGGYQSSGDIIALPDGYLYMSAASSGNDKLVRINPNTGAVQLIGTMTGRNDVYGLGFAYNTLYGFDANGNVFTIDPATAVTSQKESTGIVWNGATTNPVLW